MKKEKDKKTEPAKETSRRGFLRQSALLVTGSYTVISVLAPGKARADLCDAGCTSACVDSCTSATVVEPPPCSSCTSCTSSCTADCTKYCTDSCTSSCTADCTKWCTSGCCISCTTSTQ